MPSPPHSMIDRPHLMQAVRIMLACGLAYGGSLLIGFHEGYWALISAVIVTQPILGDTLAASRDRIIGTLIGAFAGLVVILAERFGAPEVPLFWLAMVPLALLTAIRPNRRLSCITLAIVVLVPASGAPFSRPLDRVLEILLGTAASIAVSAALPARRGSKADDKT